MKGEKFSYILVSFLMVYGPIHDYIKREIPQNLEIKISNVQNQNTAPNPKEKQERRYYDFAFLPNQREQIKYLDF